MHQYITVYSGVIIIHVSGADPGGRPPPLKLEKNMIFWRKIVIFHTKYRKNFRASLRSAQFVKMRPPPPTNMKSWIRPCVLKTTKLTIVSLTGFPQPN